VARVKPRIRPDLDYVEVDGEAVVHDVVYGGLHYLNYSAALVFGLCDGQTTISEMAEGIADVYEMPEDEVESQVRSLLRDFRRRRLLDPTSSEKQDELEKLRTSRREHSDERGRIRMQVPQST
jgi:hypothetical protein